MTTQWTAGDFFLDEFALRQWEDPNYSGTRIEYDKGDFVRHVHKHFQGTETRGLVPGYAPFCKHIFCPNFVGAKLGAIGITSDNEHLLHSGYQKRKPEELAVLSRWFLSDEVEVGEASHLDIILYSREQVVKERAGDEGGEIPDAPWAIISIKAQDEDYETPMQPITIMRNALGVREGGSGVALDKAAYDAAVAYWSTHAPVMRRA